MPAILSAAYTATPIAALTKIVYEATRPLSAGVTFVPRSEYRQILVTAAAAASPTDLLAAYEAKFGAFTAGAQIFIRATAIDSVGRRSQPITTSAVIVP